MKKYRFLLLIFALVAFGPTAWAQWSGNGTYNDPYLIASASDWNTLATNVNAGTSYSGRIFKLTANITVSEMVGTDSNRFSGTFDGDGHTLTFNKGTADNRFGEGYCGPFRYINGATIKRLHVAGAIYTSNQFAGMVGHAKGTNYIQSCHCSLTINSSRDGDGTHGGFIANNNQTSYLTNCLFDGSFISTLTTNCGGFIGWTGSGHAYFTKCLFAPTNINFTNASSCKTFARYNGSNADYTKSYYKQTFGDAQGTNAGSMTNEQLLAALGGMWEISGNAVIPIIHPYSLSLAGSGTANDPYQIATTANWNDFATYVNNGIDFSESYFKLTADITVNDMVGTDANRFNGIFNGDGHTLTFNKGTSSSYFGEKCCGPFRYIDGATFKRLHMAGSIYTSNQNAGMVGNAKGTNNFQSCHCSLTINSSKEGDGTHGGFIANNNNGAKSYFTNCLFDGSFISTTTTNCGGFIGWTEGNTSAKAYFTNCLFDPASISMSSGDTGSKTFSRSRNTSDVSISNSYYKKTLGDAQGTDASSMSNDALVAALGSGWQISGGKVVPVMQIQALIGSGTEGDPYRIASTADWNILASNVSVFGETYENKYFVLDAANITVSTMVGSAGSDFVYVDQCNYFGGVFDGQGNTLTFNKTAANHDFTAPFRSVYGATIQNLKVEGTINGGEYKLCAGLVGDSYGATTIQNCVSNVNITGNHEDATYGGFIARNSRNETHLYGCAFTGSMSGDGKSCGGFVGWTAGNQGAHVYFHDCIYACSSNTMGIDGSATYSRGYENHTQNIHYNNCYYTQSLGTVQGKQALTITGSNVTVENAGNPSSNTTVGVIGYGTGIKYNNVLYAGNGDYVSLNITAPEGYAINTVSYTYEGGSETTIDPDNGVYSFTMPDANVTINATLWNVYTKDITAYTSGENDGWYLIASPIGTVNPENVDNMISESDFDLYRFNQAVDLEWENWKDIEHNNHHFDLEPGRGYLYANSEDVTLTFTGTPYDGDGSVSLACTNDNPHENMRGWNLIGNPFGITAYIDREYYVMNTDGSDIIVSNRADYYVEAMEGIFVQANEDGETLTFTTNAPGKGHIQKPEPKQVVLNLSRDRGSVIDRAIVRMGEGQTLPKFQIRESSMKIYIPQDGKEYAIAISDMQGEMPVNFKANQSGSYTLMVSPENMEMNYLHLIDNLTGADVDLLTTSSYTFLAKTTDYESRFKLVFVANENDNENGNETFAFFSNGNWIIVNEGEATLQVIDVTGRILSSESFSDRYEKILDVVSGVYMLRLIQGNDTKVQKMVIK